MRLTLAALAFVLLTAAAADGPCPPAWNYTDQRWGGICDTGTLQSPMALREAPYAHPKRIDFHYRNLVPLSLTNNGRTIKQKIPCCDSYVMYGQDRYVLEEIHFHSPAEHSRDQLEVHLVHSKGSGANLRRLVITTIANECQMGQDCQDPTFMNLFPIAGGAPEVCKTQTARGEDHPMAYVPPVEDRSLWWVYDGSLTTPPCDQNVTFVIFRRHMKVLDQDLTLLRNKIRVNNNRRLQGTGDKVLHEQRPQ